MRRVAEYIVLMMSAVTLVMCSNDYEPRNSRICSIAYLNTLCRWAPTTITEDIVIEGYIVANDLRDEIIKAVVIADNTAGIEIKIDDNHLHRQLPLFSKVRVRCSGLTLGREGYRLIMGKTPTAQYSVDRIESYFVDNYFTIVAEDEPMSVPTCCISELSNDMLLRYVALNNVCFIDEEQGKAWCERDTTTLHGHLASVRHLTDGRDTLAVAVSGDCDYAATPIPAGNLHCEGIIDRQNGDIALRIIDYHVTHI